MANELVPEAILDSYGRLLNQDILTWKRFSPSIEEGFGLVWIKQSPITSYCGNQYICLTRFMGYQSPNKIACITKETYEYLVAKPEYALPPRPPSRRKSKMSRFLKWVLRR